jgi:general secretion pathway protein L
VPRTDRVIALAPVSRLLWIETALPPVAAAKREALLRYAIEDKLTIDPSTAHVVIVGKQEATDSRDAARHVVAAIERAWLIDVLAWLREAGLPANRLISSATGIAVERDEWMVVIDHAHARGFAKRADGFVYNFDAGSGQEPPFGLTLALQEARDQDRAPTALALQSITSNETAPIREADRAHWQQLLGLPIRVSVAAAGSAQRVLGEKSANLLTGEFAPREALGKWAELSRPALIAATLIAVTHIAFTLIDGWRLDRERLAIEAQMTQVFKTAFTAAKAIVDAPLQMRRNLEQMKRARGMAADADAEMLIARLARLVQSLPGAPAAVNALTVTDGVATLDVTLANAEQQAPLQRAVNNLPGAALGATGVKSAPLAVRIVLRMGA